MKPADIRNLTFASLVLLITGLVVPCMTIRPQLGDLTGWVKILAPEALVSESYSILGGIGAMFEGGSPGLGALLFLFSVIFPTWKLLTFLWFLRSGSPEKGRSLTLAVKLGKYSMLDVFVIAVLVVGVKCWMRTRVPRSMASYSLIVSARRRFAAPPGASSNSPSTRREMGLPFAS